MGPNKRHKKHAKIYDRQSLV